VEGVFNEDGAYRFETFDQFLRTYEAATTVLTGPEEFRRLTGAVLEQSAAQGVIYTEAFLSPKAAAEAERACGIIMRGIVTCIRHEGPEAAKPDALCAAETMGDFITGFGMGGAEDVGHQGDYAYAFDLAREAGLRLTTHAGEWGGAASVWEAVRDLRVERIGHGVQSIEDPALVDYLAENGITLEVCPGSNVALGVVPSWGAHPIERLRAAGVKVTVSTDDPPFFHTNLTREYDMLAESFGWDDAVMRDVNLTAIDAAFCDADTRAKVKRKLEAKDV